MALGESSIWDWISNWGSCVSWVIFGCLVVIDGQDYFGECLFHPLNIYKDYFEEEPLMVILLMLELQ